MAQRNPMNDRYKDDKAVGKTRKSASRAKPAKEPATPTRGKQMGDLSEREKSERKREQANIKRRMKADAQRNQTKEERKEQREKEAVAKPEQQRVAVPTTPEYKKWRRIWIILLVLAVVSVGGAWLVMQNLPKVTEAGLPAWVPYVPLGLSYAMIFGALAVDFTKIRPMRRRAQEESMAAQKSGKVRKELKAKQEEESSEETKKRTKANKERVESGPGIIIEEKGTKKSKKKTDDASKDGN